MSYFSTGAADQSIVNDLRPNDILNSGKEFQNSCGSLGAVISDFFINKCFGIPAFFIPLFIIVWSLKCMGAKPNLKLGKWFFCTALGMVWSSVTFSKLLTPLMPDSIFNPGGGHGQFICQWFEGLIGSPGLIAVLIIVALAFLTYLTSETIIVVRKIMNPMGYITNRVKFTISENNGDEPGQRLSPSTTMKKLSRKAKALMFSSLSILTSSTTTNRRRKLLPTVPSRQRLFSQQTLTTEQRTSISKWVRARG